MFAPSLVSKAISLWRKGERPDARGFIEQHPEVKSAQNLVIDLAYEEFCLRQEAGEQVDTEKFIANFPTVQHSLARMLDVHGAMGDQAAQIIGETDWPEVGTRWLDWELIEPLGRGAFSRVFLAREPALGNREVVVKCSFTGPHEAFILGSLSHPNIVPVHSSRHDEVLGLTGISMPLLGRSTLADALNVLADQGNRARTPDVFRRVAGDGPGTTRRGADYTSAVIALIQRVAQGLAAAHAVGVVHGDIKPSNVLLSFAGEPMLMDFNLSAGPSGDFERAGGTPPYMAPECLADFWRQPSRSKTMRPLDPRSDLFSVGVVLLELLLGRVPFQFDLSRPESLPREEDWQELVCQAAAASGEPKLEAMLARCLAFDPAKRYSSAAQLAGDLAAILGSKESFRRWTRRLVMATAASAVIGTTVTVWAWNYENPQSLPALLRRAKGHIEREEFEEALLLLSQAQRVRPDARLLEWSGYCLARVGHHEPARSSFELALQHEDRADLRNNLGYCCAKMRQIANAEEHFERALELDRNLQAAYHNRANMRRDDAAGQPADLPASSWCDYQRASQIGPRNGDLCLDSAIAIAYAHFRNQAIDGNLQEQIRLALSSGVSPELFRSSRFEHEQLNLVELGKQAADTKGARIPRSALLILPPPFPLPEQ